MMTHEQACALYRDAQHRAYRIPGVEREDAIQEAMLACCRYWDRWDPKRGAFSTFFSMVISQAFLEQHRKAVRPCRTPERPVFSIDAMVSDIREDRRIRA